MNKLAKETVVVILGADQRYFPGLVATLVSMLIHTEKDQPFDIQIFDGGIDCQSKIWLEQKVSKLNASALITWVAPDLRPFKSLASMEGNFIAYVRLLIPELIQVQKAIWLDSDLLLTNNIIELWNTDLEGQPMAACLEAEGATFSDDVINLSEIGIAEDAKYFNSGVLLMELAALRKLGFTTKALQYLVDHDGKYKWHDQSAINVVLHKKIKTLPRHWNHLSTILSGSQLEYELIAEGGYTYHFLQRPKPWQRYSGAPHPKILYRLLQAIKCPMPELQSFSNKIEKLKWISPGLTYYYFKCRQVLSKNDATQSRDLLKVWESRRLLKKTMRKNKHILNEHSALLLQSLSNSAI